MACLDTTLLLDLSGRGGTRRARRAERFVRELVLNKQEFTTTRFNVAELYVGVERSDDPAREAEKVRRMLVDLDILEFDEPSARIFGMLTAHLQVLGRPAGDMDVLIAAVAIANGQTLVTRDLRHFADVPGLSVQSYM